MTRRGLSPGSLRRAVIAGATIACFACVTSASTSARCDDFPDTVVLTNGGRMRGVVMEEDPSTGVTIRLPDGTVRKLTAARVKSVTYGSGGSKGAEPPPPPPTAPPPFPPPPSAPYAVAPGFGPGAYYPPPGAMPPPVRLRRRSPGLYAAGLTLLIMGIVGFSAGSITVSVYAEQGGDASLLVGGAAAIGISLVGFIAPGIPMTIVGGRQVVDNGSPAAALPSTPQWLGAPAGHGWAWTF